MSAISLPLQESQKLHVLFRLEPGCLGPGGIDLAVEFCQFAQKKVEQLDADFMHWEVTPRTNKKLPEMQFKVSGKKLSEPQAAKYLSLFGKSLDEFEEHMEVLLADLVDEFMGR